MPVFERGWWSAVLQHAYLPLRTSRTQADVTFLQPQVDMDGCILVSGLYGKPCGFNRRRAVGLVAFRDSGCNFLGIDDDILAILDLEALGLGLFLHPLFGLAVDEDTVDAVARGFVDRVEVIPSEVDAAVYNATPHETSPNFMNPFYWARCPVAMTPTPNHGVTTQRRVSAIRSDSNESFFKNLQNHVRRLIPAETLS
jgi:hypothetical protein